MADDSEVVAALVGFGRTLREEGLAVGSGQVLDYCRGLAVLDPSDMTDLYWTGRACLVSRQADLAVYDRVFEAYFLGKEPPPAERTGGVPLPRTTALEILRTFTTSERDAAEESAPGTLASSVEVLRRKRFSDCTPEELALLGELISQLRLVMPQRITRRTRPARRGRYLDLRRAIRGSLRTQGEVLRHARRRRRVRPRKLVLVLDISGSMAEYSRALLQFGYSAVSRAEHVEVFCFGTRLTRVTGALRRRRPDEALHEAARSVLDWEGGTRIGDSLREFSREWGRRGLSRGALVVICSDGLERGDPAVLAAEMARLRRLAHRIVWVNPLKGAAAYQPLARGMQAALPHIDVFVSGHDLASLETLADLLPTLG